MFSIKNLAIGLLFCAFHGTIQGQWSTFENGPTLVNGFRFDDVYFTDRQHGSLISHEGFIYTTFDGGVSWMTSPKFDIYLRTIEYISPEVGFAGSLNNVFLKTEDGGRNWMDVSERLPAEVKHICGMDHYTDQYVYGVGNYAGPAIFFKSEDSGENWSAQSLDSILFGAIDVYFRSPLEGYICGSGPDTGDLAFEGRILYTQDGGNSWEILMRTGEPYTYIWKMDFLDNGAIYGSVETFLGERPAIIRSFDGGKQWELVDLTPDPEFPFDGQGIGFLNDDLGWFAGYGFGLYETMDGGIHWERKYETANINRFFKVDSTFMLGAGFELYFFDETSVSAVNLPSVQKEKIPHAITNLSPNPAKNVLLLDYRLDRNTSVLMDICSADGSLVRHIFKKDQSIGDHQVNIDLSALPAGAYFIVLRTHERHLNKMFVKVD